MTTTMDQIHNIREMFYEQGLNISEIAEATGFNWKTVSKYIDKEDFNEPNKEMATMVKGSKLDPYKPDIDQWLAEDKKRKRKQRHTAMRIFKRLTDKYEEFNCSYRLVASYVAVRKKELKLKSKEGYLPLVHYPGEAQADFGEAEFEENGVLCKGKYLVLSLPYSNGEAIQLFYGENMECLLEGLKTIFEYWGGVPTEIWFDNTATIVTDIMKAGERKLTDRFLRFQEHYGFKAKFMNPESGWEKGSVENKVGYLRRNLLVPMPGFKLLTEYNKKLLRQCTQDQLREHYLKKVPISELFKEDQAAFKPLPAVVFETASYISIKTNKYGQFKLNNGKHTYSASPALCEENICVKLTHDTVTVFNSDMQEIVSHRRLYGDTEQQRIDWIPYLKYIARKPRSLRNTGIYAMLPSTLQEYLDKCTPQQSGKILTMMAELTDRTGFENAVHTIEVAAKHEVHDPDSLISLHRRIFSDVPVLPSIETKGSIFDITPIVPQNLSDYDYLLRGGGTLG